MFLEPLCSGQRLALRAVTIATRVVRDLTIPATVTTVDVAAERGCAAHLDRAHGPALPGAHGRAIRFPVRGTVLAKDVGDLEARPRHGNLQAGQQRFRSGEVSVVSLLVSPKWLRAANRAGSPPPGPSGSRRAYSAPSSPGSDAREESGSCARRCRPRADGLRSCASSSGPSPAFVDPQQPSPSDTPAGPRFW